MSSSFNISVGSVAGTGDVTIDTNVFKVNTTTNRVGIGTASPSSVAEIAGLLTLSGLSSGAQGLIMGDTRITGLSDPTGAQDAATKAYVDAVSAGLNVHTSVRLATVAALPAYAASGPAGVGHTLTASANGALSVDGVAVANGNRILVKDEASIQNGVYTVSDLGSAGTPFILVRATDFDGSPASEVLDGSFFFVGEGSIAASGWVQTADAPTIGTTTLVFSQFSAGTSYLAGAGLTLSGVTFNVGAHADGSITVNANDIQVGILATDAQHGSRGGGSQHALAIAAGAAGFLSGADKTKLDSTSGTNTGDISLAASGSTANANGASLSGQALTLQPASASFAGLLSASGFSNLANQSGTNSGDISLAAVGSAGSPNANAATLTGQALNLHLANASFPGLLTAADFTKLGSQSGTNTGDITLAAIGSTPSAEGASLSGQALTLQPASASFGGVLTTGSQTIAGSKTMSSNLVLSAMLSFAGLRISTGAVAPVAGAYLVGDVVINTTPVAGGSWAWVCTTSGSPGTWKEMGLISE